MPDQVLWRIEIWDTKKRKYKTAWEGPYEYVDTMFNKPYIRRYTRRVIKTTIEITHKEWANR